MRLVATPVRYRSLLVPVDLSPSSDRVLGRVALLPLSKDARVTILHVVPSGLPARQKQAAERDARRALATEARHLARALPTGVRVQSLVVSGAPVDDIAACATRLKAELIVMGRGGGRTLRDAFLGTTAERVLRRAQLPVLVVRLAPRTAYRRPALGLDLGDQVSNDVVRNLLRLLAPPRPEVAVIHAFEVPHAGLVYPSISGDDEDEPHGEAKRKATAELRMLLRAAAGPQPEPPTWKLHVREGSPSLVVEKLVKKLDSDLLLLGTRGYASAAHLFLGTVSGELLREVKCDVLVVPPRPLR